jgi:hypothetical protein
VSIVASMAQGHRRVRKWRLRNGWGNDSRRDQGAPADPEVEFDQRIARQARRRDEPPLVFTSREVLPVNREWARVLGVFHGGFQPSALAMMMKLEGADVA